MVKSISVLGSTGNVGIQTLEAAASLGIRVEAISGNRNLALLEKQARQFRPEFVAVHDEGHARLLRTALADTWVRVAGGASALSECAAAFGECAVVALSGSVGLFPTLAAINEGKRIALANKETMVCAGEIVMNRAAKRGAEIIPVDSEHSAIFQCLLAEGGKKALKNILLTASGGPFLGWTRAQMSEVTPQQAISHPNWSMGAKISVDSATLMNKGLELIEAMHLFSVRPGQIRVIIHPESIIHSMVEFIDGSVVAQLGKPDMSLPIRYALCYPNREQGKLEAPDFTSLWKLTFREPDLESFPCLTLAVDCAKKGGTCPAVLNAANEEAVEGFLTGRLNFGRIYETAAAAVDALGRAGAISLEEIRDVDEQARRYVRENMQ